MQDLLYRLNEYGKTKIYPFHMPGHKRLLTHSGIKNPYKIDITEIEGFDDLHHAKGILLEAEQKASRLYSSECTHYLVNGSTSGIMSAIFAVTSQQGKLLIARNSHKAAYHAVFLRQLEMIYVYPEFISKFDLNGGILPHKIEEQLQKNPDIEAVFITSPTAEGVVSDVQEIARVCHAFGKPLIVDEAHGAHFGFSNQFPKNSVALGADLVIASVHKTLPSFTQTALIHINGDIVVKEKVEEYLSIFQTSSPSYLLMAGIDQCMEILKNKSEKLFYKFSKNLLYFHKKTKDLHSLEILQQADIISFGAKELDPGKLVISVKNTKRNGSWLQNELLYHYQIQMEMAAPTYVLAIATIMDQKKGFRKLQKALRKIDKELSDEMRNIDDKEKREIEKIEAENTMKAFQNAEVVYSCDKAKALPREKVTLSEAQERISCEFVLLYPPGIPLIVPGERIKEKMIQQLLKYQKQGLSIQGMHDKEGQIIEVAEE